MHPNSLIPGPTYITKFLHVDQKFAEEFNELDASLLPAHIALWKVSKTLTSAVREGCKAFIIDPVTHAFSYRGYLDKTTYKDLPYSPDQPISTSVLLSKPNDLKDFTRNVLEFQLNMDVGVLIAPYFYARDLDDSRLVANIRLISEALKLREAMDVDIPLYGHICIGSIVMQSPTQVDEIVNLYSDLKVEGFMITVENFDDRSVSSEALMGLAQLARRLQEDRDIFICSIAAFGQVLTALGVNGFSAGIGWLETFREVTLQPGRKTFAADRVPRAQYYYIPELLSYVHPDDVNTIFDEDTGSETMQEEYRCVCEVCTSGIPKSIEDKKRHFMLCRHKEMAQLRSLNPDKRPQHIRERLGLALELSNIIEEEALVRIPTEHFVRWIAIIDALSSSRNTSDVEDSIPDINEIIHQIRQDNGDKNNT